LRGPGLDFEELRAYQPGDDIRAMDWRVTARMRSPFVRIYREEKERPVILVVDQRRSMFFGSVRDMKSVTAARAAAVVAHQVVHAGDRVGAIVFDDQSSVALVPRRSSQHVMRILGSLRDKNQALAHEAKGPSNPEALDTALQQVSRVAHHDHLVVLINDLSGSKETTRELATTIRRSNDMVLLWVNDPLEAALPDVGDAVLGDGQLQVQVDTASSEVRRRFAEDVAERKSRADAFALRYDVPTLPLSTVEDVVLQLRALLSRDASARRV
jgi:uncharacterized protein (DUF58 family)